MFTTRSYFYVKRHRLGILKIGLYSFACGIFFMMGMEIVDFSDSPKSRMAVIKSPSDIEADNVDLNGQDIHEKKPGILPLPQLTQPGEMGKPFKPTNLSDAQKQLMKDGWDNNAFNQYVSDLISLNRSLPDVRDPKCKEPNRYISKLPQTSVILCFHNEAWSILLRSVHSIINRSPAELLHEIILVDDCSTQEHLKSQLEQYMKRFPKVKIVRAPERVGLIRARMLGTSAATGEVLTFLDSHIEVSPGWLPPLLDRIGRNDTTVVCPVIDGIDDETLAYNYDSSPPESVVHNIGVFDWSLTFNWASMPPRQKKDYHDSSEPFASPTMAGGLFSINKQFFDHLGRYDPEFDIWGGENLELSFKIWMCGGRLEFVPCSHVGHIFRKRSPYQWRKGVDVMRKNLVRLAKVWTDDYSKHYYKRIGNDLGDFGDISGRIKLRNNLQCKSFDWYIKNIYPEIFIPDAGYAYGEIRNLGGGGKTCLDSSMNSDTKKETIGLYSCHGGDNQHWSYTKNHEIRRNEMCMDSAGGKIEAISCHGIGGNQEWGYDSLSKQLKHNSSAKCLTMNATSEITVEECREDKNQQWELENYREVIPDSDI